MIAVVESAVHDRRRKTVLTEAGYKEGMPSILSRLLQAVVHNVEQASGRHCLSSTRSTRSRVAYTILDHARCLGEGVQQALLKILSGIGGQMFRPAGGRSNPPEQKFMVRHA